MEKIDNIEKYITGSTSDFFTKLQELRIYFFKENVKCKAISDILKLYEALYGKIKLQQIVVPDNINHVTYINNFYKYLSESKNLFKDSILKNEIDKINKKLIFLLHIKTYGK